MTSLEAPQKNQAVGRDLEALLFLRVLATVAVLVGHAASFFSGLSFTQWPNFVSIQNIAVTMFFCISGYTIAWVCDTSRWGGTRGFGKFVFDRYMRLVIPLLPTILLFAVVERYLLGSAHPYAQNTSALTALGNLLFIQDFTSIPWVGTFGLNRPLWTISIEFWTYIAFAGLAFARTDTGLGRILLLAGSLCAFLLLGRLAYDGRGEGLPIIWMLSAALYYGYKRLPLPSPALKLVILPLWLCSLALCAWPATWPPGGAYSPVYNLLIFLSFALFLRLWPESRSPNFARALQFFGGFAYTAYLVHYPIMQLVYSSSLRPSGDAGALLMASLCLAFAWVFSLPFEQRYKDLRGRLWRLLTREGRPSSAHR